MSTIVVPLDFEEGHELSLFGLLKLLKDRGHRVCCLGARQDRDLVLEENIEFIPISVPQEVLSNPIMWASGKGGGFFWLLLRGVLDENITQLNPDLVLVSSHYYTEGLVIHYRYRLPIVYYFPSFRSKSRVDCCESAVIDALLNFKKGVPEMLELLAKSMAKCGNLKDIAHLTLGFPELLLIPEAFDLSGRGAEPGCYYIGDGVDLARSEKPFNWTDIDPERTLIYCALGSQSHMQAALSRRLFHLVLDVAMERPEWRFIIAIGKRADTIGETPAPGNVIITRWAPQLEVLCRADVMINHGGFGTVKECILMGVPMLVYPLMQSRDHVACAERVIHHGLGLQVDIEQISSGELGSLIEHLIEDPAFKQRLGVMREKFELQNRPEIGVQVIEDAISSFAK
jgi:MGT family glycosyltransferase